MKQDKSAKKWLKEWWDAIVFAVVVATLFRWALVEPYKIPTPSMEKSLLVGDFLFVSKMHYGTRSPITPLQLPLTHQTIWGTEIPSYLSWLELPFFRFPGFTSIKNNDPVVFNYPPELDRPIDQRTHYIKRCIGVAGDTIEIKNKVAHINGRPLEIVGEQQSSYLVQSESQLNKRFFKKADITDYYPTNYGYLVQTMENQAEAIKEYDFVRQVHEILHEEPRGSQVFPIHPDFNWTIDIFGPLYVPEEGATIDLNEESLALYGNIIKHLDHNENVEIKDGQLWIDEELRSTYTFKQNYYFMMGDNRHNSLDSRYWGFVPEDHIVGKALFVWFSMELDKSIWEFFTAVRWERIISWIE
ncbi:MAG: signal peptidase I [Cyclobacteriaceae bacterium]